MTPHPPKGKAYHIRQNGEEAVATLLKALRKTFHTELIRANLRDDGTGMFCVRCEAGSYSGRIDIGLYPRKVGVQALFCDVSLEKNGRPTTDPRDILEFQGFVAEHIRTEMDLVCLGDCEHTCTF